MTETEYIDNVRLLTGEIEEAIFIFHTAEEVNRLALNDTHILRALNDEALFWKAYRSMGQAALFMALGRIFDTAQNTYSIHKVVSSTIENFSFFSKASLKARRLRETRQEPLWLNEFIAHAWEPKSSLDLRFLKSALKPTSKLFEEIYRPIRNSIYGHRLMTNTEAGSTLFPNTNREALRNMLDVLHAVIESLTHLYVNGSKPDLGAIDYTGYNQLICDQAEKVLRKLANV